MPRGAGVDDAPVSPPSSPQKGFRGRRPPARARRRARNGSEPAARARAGRARGARGPRAGRVRHPRDGGEVRRRIASCLVDGKLRGAAEAPAAVEEVAAPAPVAEGG